MDLGLSAREVEDEIQAVLKGSLVAPVNKWGAVFLEGEATRDGWSATAGAKLRF